MNPSGSVSNCATRSAQWMASKANKARLSHRLVGVLAAIVAAALLAPASAQAQYATSNDLDITKFRMSPHAYDVLSIMFAEVPHGLDFSGGLMLQYGQNPLVFLDEGAGGVERRHRVVGDRFGIGAFGAVSLWERFSFGAYVPFYLVNKGEDSGFTGITYDQGPGMGDIGLSAKFIAGPRTGNGLGIALAADLQLPTGSTGKFMRNQNLTLTPKVIVDLSLYGYKAAANIGYVVREDWGSGQFEVGDELLFSVGFEAPVAFNRVSLLGQFATTTVIKDFFKNRNTNYAEFLGGVRYNDPTGFYGLLAAGGSVAKGYGNVRLRVVGMAGYAPPINADDRDGDGILDADDQCPDDPEDVDGFEDEDGCPDPDNDQDGILDKDDQCPMDPEDIDGFEDEDGCPDPDNDQDGILDVNDLCPNDAEDFDKFEDTDGCPDLDNDQDGIPDTRDACPNDPETVNEYEDEDGCPDVAPRVQIRGKKIIIMEKVFFEFDKAIIKRESYGILDAVAELLMEHDEIRKVRIEGHTDFKGSRRYNIRLSNRRAAAVRRYLVSRGVGSSRLVSKGYGFDQPIADNTTDEGRALNRRVAFTILDMKE
jgi:large repetitive protein